MMRYKNVNLQLKKYKPMQEIIKRFACIAAIFISPMGVFASGEEDFNKCSAFTKSNIEYLLKASSERLRAEYGQYASRAATEFIAQLRKLSKEKTLLIQAGTYTLQTDTSSMVSMWVKVFADSKTTIDSIEALSQWIAGNLVNAEHNEDLLRLSDEDIYRNCRSGNAYGDAANFATFLAKASMPFTNWGEPVVLSAVVEVEDTSNGPVQKHSWVGYVRPDGSIWCMADPFNGGVVRDATTQEALSLDTVKVWLKDAKKATRIALRPAPLSLQSNPACVFSFLLRNNTGLQYVSVPGREEGFVKASFYTPSEPGHYAQALMAPVWTKKKMAATVYFNYYSLAQQAVFFSEQPDLVKLLRNHYSLNDVIQE
jgi:hypothetical protein